MMLYEIHKQNIDLDNECWNVNYSSTAKRMKVAGVMVTVMCISLNSDAHVYKEDAIAIPESHIEFVEDLRKGADSVVGFPDGAFKLDIFSTPQFSKIELNKQSLLSSFIAKCPNSDYLRLCPLYNMLSEAFLNIDFKKAVVDVVPKMSMVAIDFNLGHKILLSVSKTLKTISDDTVVFSISVDGNIRANNVMRLSELAENVHALQKNLASV